MKSICIEDICGNKKWYNENGKPYREDGPVEEHASGNKIWRNEEGLLHREDGPAAETVDCTVWYLNGLRHRKDGPAVEFVNGIKWWYYHGEKIDCKDNEEFLVLMQLRGFW